MGERNKPKVTPLHYVDFSEAIGTQANITLYGKIVKNVALEPAASGVLHPRPGGGSLVLAQVTGFMEGGKCQPLENPVLVTLPEPDGPADACDWDPKTFVVWKNVPKQWITLHVDAKPHALVDALTLGSGSSSRTPTLGFSLTTTIGVRDTVIRIVRDWASMGANPQGADILQQLWAANNPSGPFPDAAQDLANKINVPFGTHLQGSDINPPGSIKSVDDLVSAVT
jgi:hypothetical protein